MSDWKEVDWLDAAVALKNGAHDVDQIYLGEWVVAEGFYADGRYRIREKQRTITVRIPRPDEIHAGSSSAYPFSLIMRFYSLSTRDEAQSAIQKAMKEQP